MYHFKAQIKVGDSIKDVTVKTDTYRNAVPLIMVTYYCQEIDIIWLARDTSIS